MFDRISGHIYPVKYLANMSRPIIYPVQPLVAGHHFMTENCIVNL